MILCCVCHRTELSCTASLDLNCSAGTVPVSAPMDSSRQGRRPGVRPNPSRRAASSRGLGHACGRRELQLRASCRVNASGNGQSKRTSQLHQRHILDCTIPYMRIRILRGLFRKTDQPIVCTHGPTLQSAILVLNAIQQ